MGGAQLDSIAKISYHATYMCFCICMYVFFYGYAKGMCKPSKDIDGLRAKAPPCSQICVSSRNYRWAFLRRASIIIIMLIYL